MESESGKLAIQRNRKRREQDQEWQSTRSGRRQAARAMDASGEVRNSPFPSP
jgi:hypothetical protein